MEEEINCHDFYISLQVGKENKLMNEKEKRKNWGESFSEIDQLEKGWKEDILLLCCFPNSLCKNDEAKTAEKDDHLVRILEQIAKGNILQNQEMFKLTSSN